MTSDLRSCRCASRVSRRATASRLPASRIQQHCHRLRARDTRSGGSACRMLAFTARESPPTARRHPQLERNHRASAVVRFRSFVQLAQLTAARSWPTRLNPVEARDLRGKDECSSTRFPATTASSTSKDLPLELAAEAFNHKQPKQRQERTTGSDALTEQSRGDIST
mgnify:CR=1 FL=1